ncbi:MAG: nucleotide exchange factor GrpE [Phycisphaerae bacterium]|nr:nucleotide exchange factor GrpE [Phycisphaerae bacterium]
MDEKTTKPSEEQERNQSESAEAPTDELEKLRQDLESVRKAKDEVFDRLQRVYADYANFQKRVPKNIADSVAYEKERFLRSFLPVLDNFDRTLREARTAQNAEAVIKGVQIIHDQMLTILKSHGVEPMETVNEKFDPGRHEAMLRRSEPDQEDDVVLEEFQKGYTLSGRVIRPSRVAINKVQAPPEAGKSEARNPNLETNTSVQEPQIQNEAKPA